MPNTVGPSPPQTSPSKPATTTPKKKSKSSSSRPAPLGRRNTPQHVHRLGPPAAQRSREIEGRTSTESGDESFWNYCTFCEKQLTSGGGNFLYCSEVCRQRDLSITGPPVKSPLKQSFSTSEPQTPYTTTHIPFSSSSCLPRSPPQSPFAPPHSYTLPPSDRDIIPRASPTISRPRSYFASDPFTLPTPSTSHSDDASSLTHGYRPAGDSRKSSIALASLRELSSALDIGKDSRRHNRERNHEQNYRTSRSSRDSRSSISSDEQSDAPISKSSSGVWSYMMNRGRKESSAKEMSKTFSGSGESFMGKSKGWGAKAEKIDFSRSGAGMDRPLPPRTEGGGRGKGIDLLTPL